MFKFIKFTSCAVKIIWSVSYTHLEAKQAREKISKEIYGTVALAGDNGLIETAYYPGWIQRSRLKRIYCDREYGEGFYLPSQMTDIYPKPEKYISRLADCEMCIRDRRCCHSSPRPAPE